MTSIAHYKISGTLGEGAMGVVYRATDTKLNREVALKVLTGDLTRFTREAQLLAALNHPNIAAVYGVEENALVLELVEGPTLADRIAQGPTPFDDALPLIGQLIDAIEYAHEKGVIHRDLKPANIKHTPQGAIKVLDFGLAKMTEVQPGSDVTQTIASATQTGAIMGTPAYMAPEQARAKQVDKRADIWAFGVVLYELLTGARLFDADNVGDSLAQTLTKPIDFEKAPRQAQKLLRRTLDRDPSTRLRDIGDARSYLTEKVESSEMTRPHKPSKLPWLVAAAFGLGALALYFRPAAATPQPPVVRTTLEFTSGYFLSPDGKYLLRQPLNFNPSEPLTMRRLDEVSSAPVPGTEGGRFPFWAPDSSAFGFYAGGQIRLYLVASGETRVLAPTAHFTGASFRGSSADGDIVYTGGGKIFHVPLSTRIPRELSLSLPPDADLHRPTFLPEGDGFVFLMNSRNGDGFGLYRSSLGASAPTKLVDTAVRVNYARHPHTNDWHLFYLQEQDVGFGGALMTAPVDPRSGELKQAAVQLVPNVVPVGGSRTANVDVSNNGLMLFRRSATSQPIWKLRWYDRNGSIVSAPGEPSAIFGFSLAPDRSRAALLVGKTKAEIAIMDLNSGRTNRLSNTPSSAGDPVWSPDGKWVYYPLNPGGEKPSDVVRQAADGASPPEVIGTTAFRTNLQAVTPDGRYLLAFSPNALYSFDLEAPRPVAPVRILRRGEHLQFTAQRATLSPNGKWLLVAGREQRTGYFISWPIFPGKEPVVHPVANLEISFSFFRPDGREICGVTPDQRGIVKCQAVTEVNGAPRLSEPIPQFSAATPVRGSANIGAFSADGNRILLLSTDRPEENATQFVTDWTALLRAR